MADYIRVCFPLYNRNRRGNESLTRSVINTELMTQFPQTEQSNFDLLPDLSRIKCPTLVLGGEDDPITPIEDSEDIAAAIPRELVRFERFPATGHGIVNDAPERFIEVLKEFVTS
jgi:proline iminopeptidase